MKQQLYEDFFVLLSILYFFPIGQNKIAYQENKNILVENVVSLLFNKSVLSIYLFKEMNTHNSF